MEQIGKGGMADVFFGVQHGVFGFRKLVVLKRILAEFANDQVFVSAFLSEAQIAADLHHPNVVETYDIQHADDSLFIAMEYVRGLSLSEMIADLAGEKTPSLVAARIVADIASGLHAAHTRTNLKGELAPIVHLDVTPSNLMVDINGTAKVLDYGIALTASSGGAQEYVRGKPGYIPPEYSNEGIVDPRGDIFQLGLVFQQLLTGKKVTDSSTITVAVINVGRVVQQQEEVEAHVPRALKEIISRCIAFDYKQRFASAAELRGRLFSYIESEGSVTSENVATWLKERFSKRLETKRQVERKVRAEIGESVVAGEEPPVATSQTTFVEQQPRTENLGGRDRGKLRRLIGGGLLVLVIGLVALWVTLKEKPSALPKTLDSDERNLTPTVLTRPDEDEKANENTGTPTTAIPSETTPKLPEIEAKVVSTEDEVERKPKAKKRRTDSQKAGEKRLPAAPATDLRNPW